MYYEDDQRFTINRKKAASGEADDTIDPRLLNLLELMFATKGFVTMAKSWKMDFVDQDEGQKCQHEIIQKLDGGLKPTPWGLCLKNIGEIRARQILQLWNKAKDHVNSSPIYSLPTGDQLSQLETDQLVTFYHMIRNEVQRRCPSLEE